MGPWLRSHDDLWEAGRESVTPPATAHRPAIARTPKSPTFLPYSTVPVTQPPAVSLNLGLLFVASRFRECLPHCRSLAHSRGMPAQSQATGKRGRQVLACRAGRWPFGRASHRCWSEFVKTSRRTSFDAFQRRPPGVRRDRRQDAMCIPTNPVSAASHAYGQHVNSTNGTNRSVTRCATGVIR